MTYPLKFRQHILNVRTKEGLTLEETAIRFQIGRASLTRWLSDIEPKAYNRPMRKINLAALRDDVLLHDDIFIRERAERFGVSYEPMRRALKKLNISNKKTLDHQRVDKYQRFLFNRRIDNYTAYNIPIIYIDESDKKKIRT